MAKYKKLTVNLSYKQESQLSEAIVNSGLSNKQKAYRQALALFCESYGVEFDLNDLREHKGTKIAG